MLGFDFPLHGDRSYPPEISGLLLYSSLWSAGERR